jgi:hypothetical protein
MSCPPETVSCARYFRLKLSSRCIPQAAKKEGNRDGETFEQAGRGLFPGRPRLTSHYAVEPGFEPRMTRMNAEG